MSSGWHRLPFLSHPDEIANFDFPHHAVALQRFRKQDSHSSVTPPMWCLWCLPADDKTLSTESGCGPKWLIGVLRSGQRCDVHPNMENDSWNLFIVIFLYCIWWVEKNWFMRIENCMKIPYVIFCISDNLKIVMFIAIYLGDNELSHIILSKTKPTSSLKVSLVVQSDSWLVASTSLLKSRGSNTSTSLARGWLHLSEKILNFYKSHQTGTTATRMVSLVQSIFTRLALWTTVACTSCVCVFGFLIRWSGSFRRKSLLRKERGGPMQNSTNNRGNK